MNYDILIEKIKEVAAKKATYDDPEFSAYDYSGGNYDDAHDVGMENGEILFARVLLEMLDEVNPKASGES